MAKRQTKISKANNLTLSWEESLQGFLFWKQAQGISKRTFSDYKVHVQRFFKRFPDSWQSPTLKQALLEYMSDDIKPVTFNLRLIYLRAFFDWCINEGCLTGANPLKDFKKRKEQARIVELPEETLRQLLALPNQKTFAGLRDYALIFFTLDTGIRPSEALALTKTDFDFRRLVVTIPAEVAKTRTSRILPILPPTAAAINKLISVRHPSWGEDIPVFCSNEGTALNQHTWGDRLELYGKKLGVKIRPYDLRHIFALLYLRNGGHAFALQKTLGHTDISMTKRYVNLTGEDLKETHRLASPLNRLTPKKKERVRMVKI